jgi:hypothetical protein
VAEVTDTRIVLIATYFGAWPIWFPAFLLSCAKNEAIDWLFFTDCEIPAVAYPNIKFQKMNLFELNDLASKRLGFHVQKDGYSQVDLQPAYGVIFEEHIRGYGFWGHIDIDVIWGDIRSFATESILRSYDIVSFRKDFTAGHLTLWRNETVVNALFEGVSGYREILSSRAHFNFDENVISTHIRKLARAGGSGIRVYWPEQKVFWFHQKSSPDRWYWENGKVFDAKQHEQVYLHLQARKDWVTYIDFQIGNQPKRFTFTKNGIRSRQLPGDESTHQKSRWQRFSEISRGVSSRLIVSTRFFLKFLLIRDFYWTRRFMATAVSARDVSFDRKTGRLFLKRLGLEIGRDQWVFPEGYYSAIQISGSMWGKIILG